MMTFLGASSLPLQLRLTDALEVNAESESSGVLDNTPDLQMVDRACKYQNKYMGTDSIDKNPTENQFCKGYLSNMIWKDFFF